MDMIGVVLRVVEFDDEGFSLDAIVVSGPAVEYSGPSEMDAIKIGGGECGGGDCCSIAIKIKLE